MEAELHSGSSKVKCFSKVSFKNQLRDFAPFRPSCMRQLWFSPPDVITAYYL
jgi:hypothetical protein